MKYRIARRIAVFCAVSSMSAAGNVRAESEESEWPTSIFATNTPARIVELTAHITFENETAIDVTRFVFRLTVPPTDLPYQKCRLVSDIAGVAVKTHENGLDRYIEFSVPVPAKQTASNEVRYAVLLTPVDYLNATNLDIRESDKIAATKYLGPTALVESDDPGVTSVAATLFGRSSSELQKARAAYEYPARHLKFREQTQELGAAKALKSGTGDCTEYACLFCALCRAGGLPARPTGVFNLGSKTDITVTQPNHDTAEVFLATHGWVPVDPNVGGGKYDRPVGFARGGNTQIVLKRDGWVWATWLPSDGVAPMPKPKIKVALKWRARVVREGKSADMADEFSKWGNDPASK